MSLSLWPAVWWMSTPTTGPNVLPVALSRLWVCQPGYSWTVRPSARYAAIRSAAVIGSATSESFVYGVDGQLELGERELPRGGGVLRDEQRDRGFRAHEQFVRFVEALDARARRPVLG